MNFDFKPPVSRWELIDAISKLHVIDDGCNHCPKEVTGQLRQILNNPKVVDGTSPFEQGLALDGSDISAE